MIMGRDTPPAERPAKSILGTAFLLCVGVGTLAAGPAACAAAPGVLERVARSPDAAEMKRLHGQFDAPLVLIGETVFVPSCACLEQPCKREFGNVGETREKASARDRRDVAGARDDRERAQTSEKREGGNAGEHRDRRAAAEERVRGSMADQREPGHAGEERQVVSVADARDQRGAVEWRELGGAVSKLGCARIGHREFEVMAAPNQSVRFFDGTTVSNAPDRVVRY